MKITVLSLVFLIGFLILCEMIADYSIPIMNEVQLNTNNHYSENLSVRIALLSDLHISQNDDFITELMGQVRAASPDVILLAGDYIFDGSNIVLDVERQRIAALLAPQNDIPVLAVMGNHEEWSNSKRWIKAFEQRGISALHNETDILEDLRLCVRGLGDYFTDNFVYIDFPNKCNGFIKITLTHDPAGAFNNRVNGIVLAGHTHCGQISLPFIGPIIMPTEAPKTAQCGLYSEPDRQVYVSSGIGASGVPIRFMTQSAWDLIEIF